MAGLFAWLRLVPFDLGSEVEGFVLAEARLVGAPLYFDVGQLADRNRWVKFGGKPSLDPQLSLDLMDLSLRSWRRIV
jgi:hypothetical protein